jgi:hypothetical protein
MKQNTAWYWRRFRDGALPDWQMRKILKREFDRLVTDYTALGPEMDELRRAVPEHLTGFDAASDRALQWLAENRFDLALQEIQEAEKALAELRRCVTVAIDWRRTSDSLTLLEGLLPPGLASQPTVRVLQRLRDLSRFFLDQGEMRKARFVVFLLTEQIDSLLTCRPGDPAASLARVLHDLATEDEAAVFPLRKLASEGYHRLAERLAEDLVTEIVIDERGRRATAAGGTLGALENDLAALRQQAQTAQADLLNWLNMNS